MPGTKPDITDRLAHEYCSGKEGEHLGQQEADQGIAGETNRSFRATKPKKKQQSRDLHQDEKRGVEDAV